jgi:tyrosinase
MGKNGTAGLDPIFPITASWTASSGCGRRRMGFTGHLGVMAEYPGANSRDSQGPTPGVAPNFWLILDSPLNPFK